MRTLTLGSALLALFVVMAQSSGAAQSATETQLLSRISQQPADIANYLDLAKVYRANGRFDEAERLLLRAIDLLREERRVAQVAGTAVIPGRPQIAPPAPRTFGTDPTQAPLRVGGEIREPTKIRDVKPVYPAVAQQARVSGIVILETVIDRDGNVRDATVLRSVPLLDEAAVDAVRQWQFTPTLMNGMPVEVVMTVTVNFSLK